MRIGIDARLINETGVGRYIRNLIREVSETDTIHEYVVFLCNPQYERFTVPNRRWSKVLSDVRWHTVDEQLQMPGIIRKAKLDLLHVPYHNPPVFYDGPMVITIHDLTILHHATGKATKLPRLMYRMKLFGYWLELAMGLRKAKGIITVSHATKREIMQHFKIPAEKIHVTYEGVDRNLVTKLRDRNITGRYIREPYLLYVGNAYPHKNVESLLRAFEIVRNKRTGAPLKLVLVGNDDYFYGRIRSMVDSMHLGTDVIFTGSADDTLLARLYAHAQAFVFPSKMEGFGLPALEALAFGAKVLVSDISVFHEILGKYAVYFDPDDVSDMARVMYDATMPGSRGNSVKTIPSAFLSQYSWSGLARETIQIYESSTRI